MRRLWLCSAVIFLSVASFGVDGALAKGLKINPFPLAQDSQDKPVMFDSRDSIQDGAEILTPELPDLDSDGAREERPAVYIEVHTPYEEDFDSVEDTAIAREVIVDDAALDVPEAEVKPAALPIQLDQAELVVLPDLRDEVGSVPEAQVIIPYTGEWHAAVDEAVQDVLRSWAGAENVSFRWRTNHDFRVLQNVKTDKSFETAVMRLLDQYQGLSPRPIAHLTIDPVTKHRVITVMSN